MFPKASLNFLYFQDNNWPINVHSYICISSYMRIKSVLGVVTGLFTFSHWIMFIRFTKLSGLCISGCLQETSALTVAPLLQISLYTTERISLWNIQLISTRWNFLENCVGDVDVSVFIYDSHNDCQWRAGLMLSTGQKSPQKPPGFQLTSTLEIWRTNLCFLILYLSFQLPE